MPSKRETYDASLALDLLTGGDGSKTRKILGDGPKRRVLRAAREIQSETSDQIAFVGWCRAMGGDIGKVYSYPSEALYKAVHGTRGLSGEQAGIITSKLKTLGLDTGRPDLAWDVARRGYHGLRIELKRREMRSDGKVVQTKGKVQQVQAQCLAILEEDGYCARVCYGDAEAQRLVEWYFL